MPSEVARATELAREFGLRSFEASRGSAESVFCEKVANEGSCELPEGIEAANEGWSSMPEERSAAQRSDLLAEIRLEYASRGSDELKSDSGVSCVAIARCASTSKTLSLALERCTNIDPELRRSPDRWSDIVRELAGASVAVRCGR